MVIDTMVLAYALLHVEERYQQAIAAERNCRSDCST